MLVKNIRNQHDTFNRYKFNAAYMFFYLFMCGRVLISGPSEAIRLVRPEPYQFLSQIQLFLESQISILK